MPDGDFERLPLDLLLTQRPEKPEVELSDLTWFSTAPWLTRTWEVMLAPSVGAALAVRVHGAPAQDAALGAGIFGIANPRLSELSASANHSTRRVSAFDCRNDPRGTEARILAGGPPQLQDLPRLTQFDSAITAVAAEWPIGKVTIAKGADATEAYLWRHRDALSAASVVFFGTHGFRGAQDLSGLDQPALALAPGGQASGLPEEAALDGMLKADEITNFRLHSSLVILAACNSAAPDARSSDATFSGLPRAFLAAGARAVVVSHWVVPAPVASRPRQSRIDSRVATRRSVKTDRQPSHFASEFVGSVFRYR